MFNRSWIPKNAHTPIPTADNMASKFFIGIEIAVLSLTSSLSAITASLLNN
jgi:hypothetical protein